jgi:outer membrane protein assembly factor BamD
VFLNAPFRIVSLFFSPGSGKRTIFARFMTKRLIILWVSLAFLSTSCSRFNKVLKSTDYEYKLRMAEQYYAKKDYRKAKTLYEELFPIYKGSPQFEDLYYKYAYCHYYDRDYVNSENLFKGYLEVFSNGPRAEEIEYMQAFSFYKQSARPELDQTNTVKAMGMMQVFVNTHPTSPKAKEADEIMMKCLEKLETKEYQAAQLYFNLGQYRAAALAYTTLINNYPDSKKADDYKLMIIRSYYKYAALSIEERQPERYEKVIREVEDFQDRFPESKLLKEAERYLTLSQNNIKALSQ